MNGSAEKPVFEEEAERRYIKDLYDEYYSPSFISRAELEILKQHYPYLNLPEIIELNEERFAQLKKEFQDAQA